MAAKRDPFEVLGVSAEADLDELRAAYRRAALKCHPDTRPDDPRAAARQFYEATEAYRACLRAIRRRPPKAPGRDRPTPVSPEQQAMREAEWLSVTLEYIRIASQRSSRRGRRWAAASFPTLDEPRVLMAFCPLCVAAALAAAWVAGALARGPRGGLHVGAFAAAYAVGYVLSVAAVIVGIVLTRQLVLLARQIAGYCARRALPAPDDDARLARRRRPRR